MINHKKYGNHGSVNCWFKVNRSFVKSWKNIIVFLTSGINIWMLPVWAIYVQNVLKHCLCKISSNIYFLYIPFVSLIKIFLVFRNIVFILESFCIHRVNMSVYLYIPLYTHWSALLCRKYLYMYLFFPLQSVIYIFLLLSIVENTLLKKKHF